MIQLIRVDDRLLHGQVAYSWKASLGYDAIIIVSKEAAQDDLRKMAIKMAKPEGVKLAIRDVPGAIDLLNNSDTFNIKIFVVTDTISSANELFKGISEQPGLNIGGIQKSDDKRQFTSYAYLSSKDIEILKDMSSRGIDIDFRLVPTDKAKKFNDSQLGGAEK